MKKIALRLAVPAAILTAVLSAGYGADTGYRLGRSKGGFEGKVQYCKECHGLSGEGYRGYYAIPRLAGQQPVYIENQLRAFIEKRRTNAIMANVAHVLSPDMLTALANHFHALNPRPLGGAPKALLAKGKEIYTLGIPEANIPACAACHGPEATGSESIPRLAGQLYPYMVKVLKNWDRDRGQGATPDTSAIMNPIAHSLNNAQIEAVAAYVSSLQ
ncbi:MAG TPA: c-type cytochrome [Hyphomicrobiales bacterium]|nr:c-type cytochrome [Hyphomicrobiales bacterium]